MTATAGILVRRVDQATRETVSRGYLLPAIFTLTTAFAFALLANLAPPQMAIASPFILAAVLVGLCKPMAAYGMFILSLPFWSFSILSSGEAAIRPEHLTSLLLIASYFLNHTTTRPKHSRFDAMDLWVILLMLWMSFSVVWSISKLVGIFKIVQFGYTFGVYLVTKNLLRDEKSIRTVFWFWFIAATIAAASALSEFLGVAMPVLSSLSEPLSRWASPIRSQGFYGGPNRLGDFLSVAIVLVFVEILLSKSKGRAAACIALASFLIMGLLTTLSRMAVGAFSVGALYLAWRDPRFRKILVIGAGSVIVFAVIATGGQLIAVFYTRFFAVTQGLDVSSPARVATWDATLAIIRDHGLLGIGVGSFSRYVGQYATSAAILGNPHSMYFYLVAEMGILAVLIFAGFVYSFAHLAVRALRATGDGGRPGHGVNWTLAAGATASLVVFLTESLAQNIGLDQLQVWALLGIAAACLHTAAESGESVHKECES